MLLLTPTRAVPGFYGEAAVGATLIPSIRQSGKTFVKHLSTVPLLIALSLVGCGGGGGGGGGSNSGSPVVADGLSVLAGSPEGGGSVFSGPNSVAVDAAGNIYVADTGNHVIRKISPAGAVTTMAGKPGTSGSADGPGAAARFYEPRGVAVDSAGGVYVTDSRNSTIRRIARDGTVTTLAGSAGMEGRNDGSGSAARFFEPWAIASDAAGNVLVSDFFDQTIRKISPTGTVITVAGSPGTNGWMDGAGAAAKFSSPTGLAVDAAGRLYVADRDNDVIRMISPADVVTTLAGTAGVAGELDGAAATALFNSPNGVAVDATGNVYVADSGDFRAIGNTIRKISSTGVVTTLAGTAGVTGSSDGVGAAASFNVLAGLAVDTAGNLYAADTQNNTVRKITAAGVVTTVAGVPPLVDTVCGAANGVGADAKFCNPRALAADRSGNVYVADTGNNTIRKITPAGVVSTLAGQSGISGIQDGTGTAATFHCPSGIAVDSADTVYVADTCSHRIRKISPAGVVTTLAGADWEDATGGGFVGRPGSTPTALAVDSAGTVYAIDDGVGTIRKVSATGVVSTPLGLSGLDLSGLRGIAVDDAGNLYISDITMVRIIAPNGKVTTLAGSPNQYNSFDGVGAQAGFRGAADLALDSAGRVLVVDAGDNTIRRIARDGTVTTIVGQGGSGGVMLGALPGGLDAPIGLAISGDGVLYTISENAVLQIKLPSP